MYAVIVGLVRDQITFADAHTPQPTRYVATHRPPMILIRSDHRHILLLLLAIFAL